MPSVDMSITGATNSKNWAARTMLYGTPLPRTAFSWATLAS